MLLLSLGSNLSSTYGNRFKNINLAISNLEQNNVKVIKKSSFYETPSYPDFKNPKFINVVISVISELSPSDLASVLISIETKLQRKRDRKNDPRTCDIDIIDYNRKIIKNKDLILPHPRSHLRNFVIYPLKEIEHNWIHPIFDKKIDIFFLELDKNSHMRLQD